MSYVYLAMVMSNDIKKASVASLQTGSVDASVLT